jgi:hypothetical protein
MVENLIADDIREHYQSGFHVTKELTQNSDDLKQLISILIFPIECLMRIIR